MALGFLSVSLCQRLQVERLTAKPVIKRVTKRLNFSQHIGTAFIRVFIFKQWLVPIYNGLHVNW